jgi:hypothetical protein
MDRLLELQGKVKTLELKLATAQQELASAFRKIELLTEINLQLQQQGQFCGRIGNQLTVTKLHSVKCFTLICI